MNLLNKLQDEYDQLWKYIIRPTRTPYQVSSLGPQSFTLQSRKIKRTSFQLINDRGQIFSGSHYTPIQSQSYPCVIYMHGNSSNQIEGIEYLSVLMKNNISLCTFDFSACGNAEGEFVTLGFDQWRDLQEVVAYIRGKNKVTRIGIWGRSMGAVTALRFAAQHPEIAVAVYDSPFKSLKVLIDDLCKKNSKIPMFILSGALKIIAGTIKQKAKFDIYELNPLKNEAPIIKIPGFFIVSEQDQLVPPEHSKQLFQAYGCPQKHIRIVKGDHNETRPDSCIIEAVNFLCKYLFESQIKQEVGNQTSLPNVKDEVDFFNHDLIDQHQASTTTQPETKNIDFFAENAQNKDFDFFDRKEFEKYAQKEGITKENEGGLISSLNDMFAGMLGFKDNKPKPKAKEPKPIKDGYEDLRTRINSIATSSSESDDAIVEKLQRDLGIKDESFEQMLATSYQQYIW